MTTVTEASGAVPHPAPRMRIYSYGLAEMQEAYIPLHFRIDHGPLDYPGETMGISPRHLILRTGIELDPGHRLYLKLRLAIDVTTKTFSELGLFGWVMEGSALGDGSFGYHIELEHD